MIGTVRTVHVVVHPEATHHVDRLVGGWYDSDLTPAGVRDAAAIARALRRTVPREVTPELFTSDLVRARRTANAIAETFDIVATADRRLREKSYGVADGRPQQWLDSRFRPPPAVGDRMSHNEGVAGAETKMTFAMRIYAVMDEILVRPCQHQVIVTHGFALTFVLAAWVGMPLASLDYMNVKAAPASITTLREDDFFHNRQLVELCDTSHLGR